MSAPEPTSFGGAPEPILIAEDELEMPPGAPARGERRWLLPALVVVLIVVALGVGGMLIANSLSGSSLFEGDDDGGGSGAGEVSGDATDLPIADVLAFDPDGDGSENDGGLDQANDGDPATEWVTEGYDNPIARLKPGVGIVLNLEGQASLDELRVISGNTGWAAEVYVQPQAATDLAGWGEPVATGVDLGSEATFDLGGAEGGSVLLWLIDLGPAGEDGKFRGRVAQVSVVGEPG